MLHIKKTIVVEGKYDIEKLRLITDAPIVSTGGFSLYKNKSLIEFLKNVSKEDGIIILTDSDSAGFRIRNYLKQCLGSDADITNLYIPSVKGKEKRKQAPGKEGLLGVEGIDQKTLEEILKSVSSPLDDIKKGTIDKARFFADGFSGRSDSFEKRKTLAKILKLPLRISANSMIDIINKTIGIEKYEDAVEILNQKTKGC